MNTKYRMMQAGRYMYSVEEGREEESGSMVYIEPLSALGSLKELTKKILTVKWSAVALKPGKELKFMTHESYVLCGHHKFRVCQG